MSATAINLRAVADKMKERSKTLAAILKVRSSTSEQFHSIVALKGEKGDKGDTGAAMVVKGYYETLEALQSAVPSPSSGDVYGVGTAAPYSIYVWDSANSTWVNNGNLQGAKGDKGDQGIQGIQGQTGPAGSNGVSPTIEVQSGTTGVTLTITDSTGTKTAQLSNGAKGDTGSTGPYFTPAVDANGNLSWTNNGGLTNPTTVNIKGPTGASPVRGTDYWTTADKNEVVAEAAASVTPSTIGAIADPTTKSNGQVLQYTVVDGVGSWKASTMSNSVSSVNGLTGEVTTRMLFNDITVAASAFTQMVTPTYTNFPYQASVALEGVTATMIPQVVFNGDDAATGVLAPVADSYSGGIYLYATSVPSASITIPVIILWK